MMQISSYLFFPAIGGSAVSMNKHVQGLVMV
jgi:hypothetical protein